MRAVVQRMQEARVEVAGEVVGAIGAGLLVYLGAEAGDGPDDLAYVVRKVLGLRIFPDAAGRMQDDVLARGGEVLVVSQFTLFADVRRGRRPSFERAAPPEEAERLYDALLEALRNGGARVASGRFRADMKVHGVVDGPVTIVLDSRRDF